MAEASGTTSGIPKPATYDVAERNLNATLSVEVPFDNVKILPQTPQLIALLSYEFSTVSKMTDEC